MNILEARRRTLGGHILKKTAQGNPAIATGSLARRYPGITMQGWTEQDGTPTPEAPVPIISAGTQNQETGKWDYEITIANAQTDPDKNQTVTLTADRQLTKWDKLEKRNGQWGWVYGSAEVDMSSEVTWNIHQGYEQETSNLFRGVMSGVDEIDSTDILLCNILPYYQAALVDVNGIYSLGNNLFARIIGIKSLEDFQEKIQGGKVLTKLSTETFVPLTASEQEQMNNLYTYRPTTVLSNDAGCEMSLTYKTRKSMEVTT